MPYFCYKEGLMKVLCLKGFSMRMYNGFVIRFVKNNSYTLAICNGMYLLEDNKGFTILLDKVNFEKHFTFPY